MSAAGDFAKSLISGFGAAATVAEKEFVLLLLEVLNLSDGDACPLFELFEFGKDDSSNFLTLKS
jgi:hypothetical protein